MRLKAAPSIVECSHQPFARSLPSSLFTTSHLSRKYETGAPLSLVILSNPFASKTLLKSQTSKKSSRGHRTRRSCASNSDNSYREEPSFHLEGLAKSYGGADQEDDEGRWKKKVHCATPKNSLFTGKHERDRDSFSHARFDFLEPMMLGIRPEFPDWAHHQETVMWASIEQKANSLDIPLSLRMIKKKLQLEESIVTEESAPPRYCSVKAAFASMVFIIVDLQSCALQMREALCHEDLEVITSKVQKEMHSSFAWLFQQVFSRTPDLMLHVMVLLADFSVHSASNNIAMAESFDQIQHYPQSNTSLSSLVSDIGEESQMGNLTQSSQESRLESAVEMSLWSSMVDDAIKMREYVEDKVLDHETMQFFVSPVSVEIEPDLYEDYLWTNLLYQTNLSQEPTNPLLLCNYAQFLHLVARDYDRAEECFKRAVQVLPPDAESLSQYANFLWRVRRDFWGAEERFLQALSIEPDNSYYASRYANFLWSTGGEETCFPLNNSQNPNL